MRITTEQFNVLTYGISYDATLKDALYSVLCNNADVAATADRLRVSRDWLLVASQALIARHEDTLAAYCPSVENHIEKD